MDARWIEPAVIGLSVWHEDDLPTLECQAEDACGRGKCHVLIGVRSVAAKRACDQPIAKGIVEKIQLEVAPKISSTASSTA